MAARVCSLENSAINISVFREEARRELFFILDSLRDKERPNLSLVLDPELSGLFSQVLVEGAGVLKEHGIMQFKELSADVNSDPQPGCDIMIFIIRPSVTAIHQVASTIKALAGKAKLRFHLYYTPRRTLACDEMLKKAGVMGSLVIGEFHMDLVPIEDDVLTLELSDGFNELFVNNDRTLLQTVAGSVNKMQILYGLIPNVKYKGSMSQVVYENMALFQKKQQAEGNSIGSVEPEIDTLILLDRTVDLVSPLVTPFTYEGLIDEILGINNGVVKVDSELVEDDSDKNKKPNRGLVPVNLNSTDDLYAEVRDYHTERLGSHLQNKAREIRERYEEFRKKNASISEIRDFVKRIPGLKQSYAALQLHINFAELIKKTTDSKGFSDLLHHERAMLEGHTLFEELEELIGLQEPLLKVLRLLCLQSLTSGGIKAKSFDLLRRELIQTYGFEMLLVLGNLEKVGLLRRQDSLFPVASSSAFMTVRKSLRLINDNVNVLNPKDIAYVTKGYAPLSVRLIEIAATNKMSHTTGWKTIQDTLKQLPGPSEEISQSSSKQNELDESTGPSEKKDKGFGADERKVMVVFFIGGITFMEIAALRHLAKQPECPFDIVIATTKILNGNTLIKSICDKELLPALKL
ncbi:unnamed protein product [Aphanomyces euteiches]|uniref:Vacuolar protein sorting-associated protein 33A n=1 Tax=Aphanomyces euteiches TaxID=100861 RepID=A0A6G0WKR7_9STRA|nr:hypothetical protein Ae201684_014188 [Aphanomyces euteiches]KAH9068779.1 hypothetical protein Ae201684P_004480 [Aphanomyces euteiches]KAH9110363.1 hypothetical protein AeMF1_014811 [Aphanomyces euteiches]KAH9119480.1 hypothetical protein LEN26_011627 [Aphanomyces euteiches]KAH9150866.1 hypothetical protein AeRB84_006380 [Aphanomyces euteiches]